MIGDIVGYANDMTLYRTPSPEGPCPTKFPFVSEAFLADKFKRGYFTVIRKQSSFDLSIRGKSTCFFFCFSFTFYLKQVVYA